MPNNYPPIQDLDHNSKAWVEWFRNISNELSGGSTGTGVSFVEIGTGDTVTLNSANTVVIISASTADTTLILPYATSERVGQTVSVTLIDNTFNGIITPKSGETIIDETGIIMNGDYQSLDLMIRATGRWVFV